MDINEYLKVNDLSESFGIDSGSIITKGGVGIAKKLNVGGSVTINEETILNGYTYIFDSAIIGENLEDILTVNSQTSFGPKTIHHNGILDHGDLEVKGNVYLEGDVCLGYNKLNNTTANGNLQTTGETLLVNSLPNQDTNGRLIFGNHLDNIKTSAAHFSGDTINYYDPVNWILIFNTTDSRDFTGWYIRIISGEASGEIKKIMSYNTTVKRAQTNGHFIKCIFPNDKYVLYDPNSTNIHKISTIINNELTIVTEKETNYKNWYLFVLSGDANGKIMNITNYDTSNKKITLSEEINGLSIDDTIYLIENYEFKGIIYNTDNDEISFSNFLDPKTVCNQINISAKNGNFDDTITALNLSTVSDRRLKKDIKELKTEEASAIIHQINSVKFKWKNNQDNNEHIGFIAQDVEKVIPSIVHTDKHGYKSIQYDKLIPILLKTIQDMSVRIAFLENKMKTDIL